MLDTKPHKVSLDSSMTALGLPPSKPGYTLKQLIETGRITGNTHPKDRLVYKNILKPRAVRILVVGLLI